MDKSKLDPRLHARHLAFERTREGGKGPGHAGAIHVAVAVIFEGDPARLAEAGLIVRSVYGPVAYGDVRVADLARLSEVPGVKRIERESRAVKLLDESVPEIHAPAVWNGVPSYKGAGVVVGVVDTGIDVLHHCFRKNDDSSRILAIWDQTLPTSGPPAGFSYGQFFDPNAIKDALAHPDKDFAHQDVDGHGTHVAGTAAGNGSQSGNCHLSDHFIGVAPEADIVVVKSEFAGSTYVDGVKFVFDQAGAKPAVVNLSLGGVGAPHDGTDPDEIALDALLTAGTPGRAVVAAAGNTANKGFHGHRRIEAGGHAALTFHVHAGDRFGLSVVLWYGGTGIPAGGPDVAARLKLTLAAPGGATVDISPPSDPPQAPFAGGTVELSSRLDVHRPGRHRITVDLDPPSQGNLLSGDWQLRLEETAGAGTDVDCWLAPYSELFVTEPVAASATVKIAFYVRDKVAGISSSRITYTGAARLSIVVTTPDPDSTDPVPAGAGAVSKKCGKHTVRFVSELDVPGPGTNRIVFFIDAPVGKEVDKGLWTVTLTETAGSATTVEGTFPEKRPKVTIIDGPNAKHSERNIPRLAPADREPARTIESPATAQNVIAVGAYDPESGVLAGFSSRGPTVDGRHKPDLCAPGVAITAPKSRKRGNSLCSDCCLSFYKDDQGTSQAAPHVTGVVALMFEKNKTLDFVAVRTALRDHARPVPGGALDDWGTGKLDAQLVMASIAAAGGGWGGGGGGGGHLTAPEDFGEVLPLAAAWPRYVPTPYRIAEIREALATTPAGNLAMALISRHVDELVRIVNEERRVATVWHRMQGPALLRTAVGWQDETRPPIPATFAGRSVTAGLSRLLRLLERYATPALLGDLVAYRAFALSLPGAVLAELGPFRPAEP